MDHRLAEIQQTMESEMASMKLSEVVGDTEKYIRSEK